MHHASCDMTHTRRVLWLIHMDWQDSFICVICRWLRRHLRRSVWYMMCRTYSVKWLPHMHNMIVVATSPTCVVGIHIARREIFIWCAVTHIYCVTWRIHVVRRDSYILCDVTHLYVWHDDVCDYVYIILCGISYGIHMAWRDSCIWCAVTHTCCVTWRFHLVWHGSYVLSWIIHKCDITVPATMSASSCVISHMAYILRNVWHIHMVCRDSYILFDVTHSCCVTWLIHTVWRNS